jgi:hypothetical protein
MHLNNITNTNRPMNRGELFQVLTSCMTLHRVCNLINTTGATSGAGKQLSSQNYLPVCMKLSVQIYYICLLNVDRMFFLARHPKRICLCYLAK